MFGIENYFGFLAAGIILNLTPGADTLYILTRSVSQGKRAGNYSVFGIIAGTMIHTTLAALGLSIILAKSVTAFMTVKYLGVAYLIYLGVRMIINKNNIFDSASQQIERTHLWKIFRQGMLTNLLNPKVALFFLAFLPQFVNVHNTYGALPFLLLGMTFMTTGLAWCLVLANFSSSITGTLRNNDRIGKWMQRMSGLIFISIGLNLLMSRK
jgi:RhtB (resistance to homoserine/threonine) family protein